MAMFNSYVTVITRGRNPIESHGINAFKIIKNLRITGPSVANTHHRPPSNSAKKPGISCTTGVRRITPSSPGRFEQKGFAKENKEKKPTRIGI